MNEDFKARRDWERGVAWEHVRAAPVITPAGLVLGAGTVLARMRVGATSGDDLALDGDHDRLVALLVVLKRGGVSPILMEPLRRAAADWLRGERALANLRLAFVPLPRIESRDDAYRLHLADRVLAAGIEPDDLLKALDLPPGVRALLRKGAYAAGQRGPQPHLPAGTPEGGRFTSYGDGGAATSASVDTARATPVFYNEDDTKPPAKLDPDVIFGIKPQNDGHTPFVPRVPFVPMVPNGGLGTGGKPLAVPRLGVPPGAPLPDPAAGSTPAAPGVATDKDKPRPTSECLPSEPDVKHWASPAAAAWQRFVNFLANPFDPTPDGQAHFLLNWSNGGKRVSHDDCIKSDLPNGIPGSQKGDMVEAKNKAYDFLLNNDMKGKSKAWEEFADQVDRQNASLDGSNRKIFYCFEGQAAADKATKDLGKKYEKSVFLKCGGAVR